MRRQPYRNILVPVDGSAPAGRAIREAIQLARQLKARITAVHVITPFEAVVYARKLPRSLSREDFEQRAKKTAAAMLSRAQQACRAGRVPSHACTLWDTLAADAIVRAARLKRCDLIVMATHGRHGMERVLMGSVTRAVLAQSRIPVVVCR